MNDEQMSTVDEAYRCFFPRLNWASGNWRSNEKTIDIALRLGALVDAGQLEIAYASVPQYTYEVSRYRYSPYEDLTDEDHYMREIYSAVNSRRGKSDLKDEMWTAYKFLQAKYPGEHLHSHYGGLPFMYTSPDAAEGITAGNIEPEIMLQWMMQMNMTTLHLIGFYFGIPEGEAPYEHRPEGMTGMVTMTFTETAMGFMSEYFEEYSRKLLNELGMAVDLIRESGDPMPYTNALYPRRRPGVV